MAYRYVLDCAVAEAILTLSARQRERFIRIFRQLAEHPFQTGEEAFRDSLGREIQKKAFEDWQVDAEMMRAAKKDALFMHCLPAHRGEEVTAEVIDGPQSVVWDEAENRLHTQKALLEFLLLGKVQA